MDIKEFLRNNKDNMVLVYKYGHEKLNTIQ